MSSPPLRTGGAQVRDDDAVPPADRDPTPRGRTPSRDVEQALVDAAEAVLVRDGPRALTVRAVATQAGVAPMGVYSRFGGKDGLVEAVLVRGFEGLRAAVAVRDETGAVRRLRESGVRYREFALAHPAHYAVMFEGAVPLGPPSPALAGAADAAFQELVGHVRGAMDSGALAAGDPQDAAQQIWSCVHGAVTLELKGLVRTADAEATYLRLLDLLVRGFAAR